MARSDMVVARQRAIETEAINSAVVRSSIGWSGRLELPVE